MKSHIKEAVEIFTELLDAKIERRGMSFSYTYDKVCGWVCEIGSAHHNELIAVSNNPLDAARHAQKFFSAYPDFFCGKLMSTQGVEWEPYPDSEKNTG